MVSDPATLTFKLVDPAANFVAAGVAAGDTVRITSGSNTARGDYSIVEVAQTALTLSLAPGDSQQAGDVAYVVFNQDDTTHMPVDAAFNVLIPATSADVFVHTATAANNGQPRPRPFHNVLPISPPPL